MAFLLKAAGGLSRSPWEKNYSLPTRCQRMAAHVRMRGFVSRTRCSVLLAMRSIVQYAAPQSRDPNGPRISSAPPWRVEDARKRAFGAAQHPGNTSRVSRHQAAIHGDHGT